MPKNVLTDADVKRTGYLSKKNYPELFRLVRYYDEEDDREFTFLTNAKHLSALDVANLYRNRWFVELFFKWLKQHLKIKKFWGTAENAVRIQSMDRIIVACTGSYSGVRADPINPPARISGAPAPDGRRHLFPAGIKGTLCTFPAFSHKVGYF